MGAPPWCGRGCAWSRGVGPAVEGERSICNRNTACVNRRPADMVEKEARRLEVMKRRQERELSQLISYELMRKEMQEKAEAKVGTGGSWGGWLGG